ncbi:MAG: hypothetical protein ABIP35_16275 [Ginsengibacter sp.]
MNYTILKKPFWLLLFFLIINGCNEADKLEIERSASAFDIKQGEASIKRSNEKFMHSFEEADSVDVASCYTTNAHLLLSDTPAIESRDNIRMKISRMMNEGIKKFDLKTSHIWGDSAMLVEEGSYKMFLKDDKQLEKGKYITLWQEEGGNWRMYRQMWNSDKNTSDDKKKKVIPAKNKHAG